MRLSLILLAILIAAVAATTNVIPVNRDCAVVYNKLSNLGAIVCKFQKE